MSDVPEPEPTIEVVRALVRRDRPDLADREIRPTAPGGSSNWVFRLGDDLAVRLPRGQEYVEDLLTEARWLPRLAPQLPLPIPAALHVGEPSELFGRSWAVVTWVPGDLPGELHPAEQVTFARSLGRFLRALHAADTEGQPAGPPHWGYRSGEPVTERSDGWLETAATDLADLFDPAAVRRAWTQLRDVPAATQGPCWVHADLSRENVLVGPDGALSGVIDFGCLGIGDPSVDLLYAWSLLDAPARETLREAAGADDATWARARAWAFVGPGLLTIAHYRTTMPGRVAALTRGVEAVAAEVGVALR